MPKKEKKQIKKIILIIVLVIAVLFASCFSFRVVRDTASVGLDYITFKHPLEKISVADMKVNIENANKTLEHPFVLVKAADFDRVRQEFNSKNGDEYIKNRMSYAISVADSLINEPCLEYELDEDGKLLETSREAVNRIMTLAGVWQITNDEKYAKRCYLELDAVCNFPDWHDEHFLDVTEMSFAVSLGYDWLYDYLDTSQKDFIAEKIYAYGIDKADTKKVFSNWWLWSKVNWNTQCYGGMGVASMVFSDYYPEEAAKLLSAAYYWMPLHYEAFSPDGVYTEGNSYWEAMSSYLLYFISTSRNYFDSDFGLSELSGFDKIGYFPLYISAPDGVFNSGDNRNEALFAPSIHWFANEYNEPMLSYFQMRSVKESEYPRESLLNCLWYNPNLSFTENKLKSVPLAVHMKSDVGEEFVTVRSAYCDENATYIGMKGGYNYTNHGDLDIGSFVFDALGERWILDLGKASYSAPGYFNGLVGGGRWKVYSKRAEGHNTLVVNPNRFIEDQYPFAKAGFTSFTEQDGGATATLNMTDAYCGHSAANIQRTLEVYDNYKCASITDEIECGKSSDIWWFAHTDAAVELIDNGKTARLTKTAEDGTEKCILIKINSDTDAVFTVDDAKPLADSSANVIENIDGVSKLSIHMENVKNTTIKVTLEPQYSGD